MFNVGVLLLASAVMISASAGDLIVVDAPFSIITNGQRIHDTLMSQMNDSLRDGGARTQEMRTKRAKHTVLPLEGRGHSYPLLTGDTLRFAATWVVDDTTNNIKYNKMKDGDVVFVKTGSLTDRGFSSIFNKIRKRFVLITHNGDDSPPVHTHRFLDSKKLIAWYAQNPNHPRMTAIPIGLQNTYRPNGDMSEIASVFQDNDTKTIDCFAAFSENTRAERVPLHNLLKSMPNVQIRSLPHLEYLRTIRKSNFTISPPGNGVDCHRHWESLLYGSVPVVLENEALIGLIAREPQSFCVLKSFEDLSNMTCQPSRFRSELPYFDYWWNEILRKIDVALGSKH